MHLEILSASLKINLTNVLKKKKIMYIHLIINKRQTNKAFLSATKESIPQTQLMKKSIK